MSSKDQQMLRKTVVAYGHSIAISRSEMCHSFHEFRGVQFLVTSVKVESSTRRTFSCKLGLKCREECYNHLKKNTDHVMQPLSGTSAIVPRGNQWINPLLQFLQQISTLLARNVYLFPYNISLVSHALAPFGINYCIHQFCHCNRYFWTIDNSLSYHWQHLLLHASLYLYLDGAFGKPAV